MAMSGVSVASRRRALGGSGGSVQSGDVPAAALVESADVPVDVQGSLYLYMSGWMHDTMIVVQ